MPSESGSPAQFLSHLSILADYDVTIVMGTVITSWFQINHHSNVKVGQID